MPSSAPAISCASREVLAQTRSPPRAAGPIAYVGAQHVLPDARVPRILTEPSYSAYVKVSEGCNHRCAFCIIPKIRGPHESRPVDDVVAEVAGLAAQGVREVNLIAQDLTAYGRDLAERATLAALTSPRRRASKASTGSAFSIATRTT